MQNELYLRLLEDHYSYLERQWQSHLEEEPEEEDTAEAVPILLRLSMNGYFREAS